METITLPPSFPDHTQLPESDGTFVKNFQEHPQSIILTDSIGPILEKTHPDGQYAIGQDSGIYWRKTEPPEQGAEATPDWFYVPGVPPLLDGQMRRSYVLWRELITPLIVLESLPVVPGRRSEIKLLCQSPKNRELDRESFGSTKGLCISLITGYMKLKAASWKYIITSTGCIISWNLMKEVITL